MADLVKDLFGAADYAVFALVLLVSAAIGLYYAIAGRNKTSTQDLLLGGRNMGVFPVAMSVMATFMSAVTMLGTPAETYRYGTQYIVINLAFVALLPATAHLYLPVYHNLGLTSAYQYLEMRFNKVVRTLGSIVFTLHMLMYMPIVLYAPSLALAEVTGIGVWTSVLSIGLVCTFYTSVGGIKAVIWTDLFQALMMYAAIFMVVIKGSIDIGGLSVVWEKTWEGQRVEFFNFSFDPTVRHTFWTMLIGGYITWMGNFAANQALIQRYLSIRTLAGAQACLWINLPLLLILITVTSLCGLVIYAFYAACDPIGAKIIDSPDQLLPRFVMETLGSLPGIPGLFVAGLFSGALSTLSSGLNALSAVALEDFIKAYFVKDISEIWATRMTKIIAVVYGLLSISLVLVAQQLGGVLQAALSIFGMVGSPMLGLFTLGMFFPFANSWGAITGLISGLVMSFWFGMGAFVYKPYTPEAPMSYQGCPDIYFNATGIDVTLPFLPITGHDDEDIFAPYRFSYLWQGAIGCVVVLVVGSLVSLCTGCTDNDDERLISPVVLSIKNLLGWRKKGKVTLNSMKKSTSLSTLSTSFGDSELNLPTKGSITYASDFKA